MFSLIPGPVHLNIIQLLLQKSKEALFGDEVTRRRVGVLCCASKLRRMSAVDGQGLY